ncbi:MAG: hypothetical protein CHACPFDD_00800 [Phycisphaerae bacterium]|nr:hypothetical protein [Phycisphaerae bacterium]
MRASKKYLRPEVIARLRGLELRARSIVAGNISGRHRSAYHGFSVEFAEHREYTAGDDLRHIDWRLFGRKDRLYVKQYEEETNLRCNILLDVSRSMDYGAGGQNKFDYACTLAASLAYLLIHQQDAVGLLTFDHEVRQRLAATSGRPQLNNVLSVLNDSRPDSRTDVRRLFHQLAEELRRRSMAILISDLLTDIDDVILGIEHIQAARHELIVMHVMHDDEWEFPFVDNVFFEGLEDQAELLADPQSLRSAYLEAVRRFAARVRAACLDHGVEYVAINTRDPVEYALSGYLARRADAGLQGTRR